jgi:phospho-N-acetylmuramoyl-pentapeptide-transferase
VDSSLLLQFLPLVSAFGLSFIGLYFGDKWLLPLLEKIGFIQHIREEGPKSHLKKSATPTAGGIAFLITIPITLISLLLFSLFSVKSVNWSIAINILAVLFFAGFIGFLDDFLKKVKKRNEGLKPKEKIFLQILLTIFFTFVLNRTSTDFFGINIDLFGSKILMGLFVFFVLAGSMNAANLTDGLDGLAASVLGVGILGLSFLILFTQPVSMESLVICFSLMGVCLGFLKINSHPAKVFMGDTGSFLLGGSIAAIALMNNLEWYLLLVALVPIGETLSVILQVLSFKFSKKFFHKEFRLFKMAPFHHHLELSGFSETQIVPIMTFVQVVFCILAGLVKYKLT